MRQRIARILVLATSLLALGATVSMAQVDVELAFTPDTATSGEQVTLFARLANQASTPVWARGTLTITLGEQTSGDIPLVLPLRANADRHAEIPFVVPPLSMGGTLTITLTVSAAGTTDSATASLTILPGETTTTSDTVLLRAIGTEIGTTLIGGDGATPTTATTIGDVKRLYR